MKLQYQILKQKNYLFVLIVCAMVFSAVATSWAHECVQKNKNVSVEVDKTTIKLTIVKSDQFEQGDTKYTPKLTGQSGIATINPNASFNAVDAEVTFTGLKAGTTTFEIKWEYPASNPLLSGTCTVTVTVEGGNSPPELVGIPDMTMTEGETLIITVSASDPDADNITLTVNNLPPFASFTPEGGGKGTIAFGPGLDDAAVYAGIEVIAIDNGNPQLSDTTFFTLTVNNVNQAPAMAFLLDLTMSVNDSILVAVSATDADGDTLIFKANNLPSFATLTDNSDGTGEIEFTPGKGAAGDYLLEVTATDNGVPPLSDTTFFNLTVIELQAGSSANGENQNAIDRDPVNLFNGELFTGEPVDIHLQGPLPLFFKRYYAAFLASDGFVTGALGNNWLHNFDWRLT